MFTKQQQIKRQHFYLFHFQAQKVLPKTKRLTEKERNSVTMIR